MTKKRVLPVKKYEAATFQVQDTLLKTQASCMPTNLAEEKEKFLRNGKTPKFHIKDRSKVEQLALKTKNNIRFELFGEAQYILEKVRDLYGNGEHYLEHAFGPRITKEEATPILLNYIAENNVPESLKINWCENLTCSAKMVWTGPNVNSNRPELRKYSLWLNGSDENPYMRESGIRCLMDHEIGTHFYRSFNDGLQPWYADRERFGLRKLGTFEGQCTEEGLAAIHTVLRGRIRYLWGAAMGYYIACKSAEMTFKELFDHLGRFTSNQDYRWKQAMRVKRGLPNPNDLGGFGNDQCYFEGAVNILRRMEDIDFQLMMMGKVCYDELHRIKRVARKDVVQYPNFIKSINAYKKSLRKILALNGLEGVHPQHGPPAVYVKHLEEKKRGKTSHKGKKVRGKGNFIQRNGKSSSRNKKSEGSADEDCEIKSFSCSHPFVNLHQRKKAVSELENLLYSESEGLRDVKELTGTISAKDSLLEMQLQKLQHIVKNHQWSNRDEFNVKMETLNSEKNDIPPTIHKSSESLPNSSRCVNKCNSNSYVHASEGPVSELSTDKEIFDFNSETCPETISYTLCPNGDNSCSTTPTNQYNFEDVRSICIQNIGIDDLPLEAKKEEKIAKSKNRSRPNSQKVLVRKSIQESDKATPSIRRKVLHTPVADFSNYNDIYEQKIILSEASSNLIPSIQKRISLNNPKTSDTEKNDGDCLNHSLLSSSPPQPVNSSENLCRDRLFERRMVNYPHRHRRENSRLNKSYVQKRECNDSGMLNPLIQNGNASNQMNDIVTNHIRPASRARPLSSGSERILEIHWRDIQTSSFLQRKPLQPSVTAVINLNNKNNSLAPIKHTAFSVDRALLHDAF